MRPAKSACLVSFSNYLGTQIGRFAGLSRRRMAFEEVLDVETHIIMSYVIASIIRSSMWLLRCSVAQ